MDRNICKWLGNYPNVVLEAHAVGTFVVFYDYVVQVSFFFPLMLWVYLDFAFVFCYDHAGGQRTHTKGGAVILADEIKNPAMEKLELVRKWSLNTYKVCNF